MRRSRIGHAPPRPGGALGDCACAAASMRLRTAGAARTAQPLASASAGGRQHGEDHHGQGLRIRHVRRDCAGDGGGPRDERSQVRRQVPQGAWPSSSSSPSWSSSFPVVAASLYRRSRLDGTSASTLRSRVGKWLDACWRAPGRRARRPPTALHRSRGRARVGVDDNDNDDDNVLRPLRSRSLGRKAPSSRTPRCSCATCRRCTRRSTSTASSARAAASSSSGSSSTAGARTREPRALRAWWRSTTDRENSTIGFDGRRTANGECKQRRTSRSETQHTPDGTGSTDL